MLHCYGENSFTFLLFQELNKSPEGIPKFISNLKNFRNGKKFLTNKLNYSSDTEPQIWLFPNFGKRHGFGEPDAIVLIGKYTFWIEVETHFDLIKRTSSARAAINQLFRFHYFNRVLANERTRRTDTRRNHWAWMGPTINSCGEVKEAVLRVAGHKALKEIEPKLTDAAKNGRDHYVLLTECEPQGLFESKRNSTPLPSFFKSAVKDVDNEMHEWSKDSEQESKPAEPNIERFWYQYYRGDLNRKGVSIEYDKIKYESISSNQKRSGNNR